MKYLFQLSLLLIVVVVVTASSSSSNQQQPKEEETTIIVERQNPSDVQPTACSSYDFYNNHNHNNNLIEKERLYHSNESCNVIEYNNYKERLERHRIYNYFKKTKTMNLVPNQRTVVCPMEVQDLKHEFPQQLSQGYDTVWIVENVSSDPIVLSYIKGDGGDGDNLEYSAMNPTITPPHHDPMAILLPNHWKSIRTYDGHVFHARIYDSESQTVGPVVLQHRPGLIPIGRSFHELSLSCPDDGDPEPLMNSTRVPEFARTNRTETKEGKELRACNTIDIGFRNVAPCPLHGYWIERSAGPGASSSSSSTEGTTTTTTTTSTTTDTATSMMCQEKFRFHLGLNSMSNDFMWDWNSNTKFEGSAIGHTFAFRLAADPNVLIETITLQPTQIIDCPELKKKQHSQINKVTAVENFVNVITPLGDNDHDDDHHIDNNNNNNNNNMNVMMIDKDGNVLLDHSNTTTTNTLPSSRLLLMMMGKSWNNNNDTTTTTATTNTEMGWYNNNNNNNNNITTIDMKKMILKGANSF